MLVDHRLSVILRQKFDVDLRDVVIHLQQDYADLLELILNSTSPKKAGPLYVRQKLTLEQRELTAIRCVRFYSKFSLRLASRYRQIETVLTTFLKAVAAQYAHMFISAQRFLIETKSSKTKRVKQGRSNFERQLVQRLQQRPYIEAIIRAMKTVNPDKNSAVNTSAEAAAGAELKDRTSPSEISRTRRGRKRKFTQRQLDGANQLKLEGKTNNEAAKVLYGSTPTDSQRRSVSTILKHHFGSNNALEK